MSDLVEKVEVSMRWYVWAVAGILAAVDVFAGSSCAPQLSWRGRPIAFELRERYCTAQADRVAGELRADRPASWKPSGTASSCVPKTEGSDSFVKIGGGPKFIGEGHGVVFAQPIPVAAGATGRFEVDARVAKATDTLIVYLRAYDAQGRDVTSSVAPPPNWSYSIYSKCLVRYPVSTSDVKAWTLLKIPFLVPDGVAAIVPRVCPWRGDGADIRAVRFVEGAASLSRTVVFDGPSTCSDGVWRVASARDALALEVRSAAEAAGVLAFEVEVADRTIPPRPRALDLVVTVPADLAGWTWHRNWRADEAIVSGTCGTDAESVGGFAVTRYPFSAVSTNGTGFAFGTPFDAAAYESRVVTSRGIASTTPIGLLARGNGVGTRATCRYLLFPFEGRWGFRSAAKAYYAHEGRKFAPPLPDAPEGTWVWPIWPSAGPKTPGDFGHTFWEAPMDVERKPDQIRRAHELGICVFPYTEVWGMRQDLPTRADGSHPSVPERIAELTGWAAEKGTARTWFSVSRDEAAQACLNSMPMGPDGQPAYVEDHWDNWTTWWRTNPDPRLAKPNRCSICWDHLLAPRLDDVDGVYLDSVAYGFSVDYRNVRPEHLEVFDAPLVYDIATLRPCTDGMQHMVVFVDWLSARLRPRGKRLFGNTFGISHRFNAKSLDVFGCEVGSWGSKPGEKFLHSVIADDMACEQRFFAYRRPVSNLLQEGHWERICPETTRRGIELYIENQMFYGFYPAVSTIGGEKKVGYRDWVRYFDRRGRYERDRDLFARAIPVIRRLNRAGWEPETLLRSSHAKVMAERFGARDMGRELLFTVRNASDKEVETVLRTEELPSVRFETVWGGVDVQPGTPVRLKPWQVLVLRAREG